MTDLKETKMAKGEAVVTGYVLPDSWSCGAVLAQDEALGLVLPGERGRYPVRVTLTGGLRIRGTRTGGPAIRCRVEFLGAEGLEPATVGGWYTDPRLA
jgi:hypothetical protein